MLAMVAKYSQQCKNAVCKGMSETRSRSYFLLNSLSVFISLYMFCVSYQSLAPVP